MALLRRSEIRGLFRLIQEIRELKNDPLASQQHLLRRLCECTGAHLGIVIHSSQCDTHHFISTNIARFGLSEDTGLFANQAHWEQDALTRALRTLPGRAHTRTESQLLKGTPWQHSAGYSQLWQTAHVQHCVAAIHRPGTDGSAQLMFICSTNTAPFSPRQVARVRAVNCELYHLAREGTPRPNALELPSVVTRRQREVLLVLLEGYGVKDTARRLNISPRTVEDHIKALYQVFGVHSRSALMARFIR